MLILVCYDVGTTDELGPRRLRRLAQACKDHGIRVQYSVFECRVEPAQWVFLRRRLLKEFDAELDSLRFYFLAEDTTQKTEHHGIKQPLDVMGPLVI